MKKMIDEIGIGVFFLLILLATLFVLMKHEGRN